ncbi:hypothetical protein [Plantactinospora sp. B5E13]|uniref:hypothetical protein n=1 Tax=unclassified Plantactinospora TaxID=2631981 RepID=UPI00325E60EE
MTVSVGAGSVREILVVLALALCGLLLATLVAFTPWYGMAAGNSAEAEVVEVHSPAGPPMTAGVSAASNG